MKALQDFRIFIKTARLGSLSETARQMDLTPAATSAAVKRLEAEVGTALFIRSTRNLRLTPHGELFLSHCEQAVEAIEDGFASVKSGQSELTGLLQIALPSDLGRRIMLRWIDEFIEQNPKLSVRLHLSDSIADMYRQPVDIALRYGNPPDSSLIALPVAAKNQRVLCASPEYLEKFGAPTHPGQLTRHNCLCFALSDSLHARWHFYRDTIEESVHVSGNRMANDGDAVRRWAIAGHGIAYKSLLDIAEDLEEGKLVRVCPEWQGETAPLNLICASRRQLSPAIQALREHLSSKANTLLHSLN